MSLSEIITDSIKYPFSDITKFIIVGIVALLAGLASVFSTFEVDSFALIVLGSVVSLVFSLILSGYGLNVIKNTLNFSDALPDIDPVNNFIDGIKVFIISLVYFLIPFIITFILALITGAIGVGLDHIGAAVIITVFISVIVFILFSLFEVIALARFAKTEQFGDAFNLGEIVEDIKKIGFVKLIGLIIIVMIVIVIAVLIVMLVALIPFVGIIVSQILMGAFVSLFYNRAIGLLYADI